MHPIFWYWRKAEKIGTALLVLEDSTLPVSPCAKLVGPSVKSQLSASPWTVTHQATVSPWNSPGLSGLPFPSPGDLPDPRIKPGSPALHADSSPSEPPGKPGVLSYLWSNTNVIGEAAAANWDLQSAVSEILAPLKISTLTSQQSLTFGKIYSSLYC